MPSLESTLLAFTMEPNVVSTTSLATIPKRERTDTTPKVRRDIYRCWKRVPAKLRQALEGLLTGKLPWPAYIFGGTGTGKTCAALLVFDEYVAMRCDAAELAACCWQPEHVVWRQAKVMPLVIVDEVGTGTSDRDWLGLKKMADIRANMPTLWLSNLSPEQLKATFDDRIFSRLCCGTVVEVTGPDQRFARRIDHV